MAIYRGGRLHADRPGRARSGRRSSAARRTSCRSSACRRSSAAASRRRTIAPAARATALLSDAFWRSRFGGDPIGDRQDHHAQSRAAHRDRRRARHPPAFVDGRAGVGAAARGPPRTRAVRSQSQLPRHREAEAGRRAWRARRPTWTRSRSGSRCSIPTTTRTGARWCVPLQEDMIGDVRIVAAGAARRRRAGAADRVRQPRQPDAGAHARPRQGDRRARTRSAPAACAWFSSCWPKGSCSASAAGWSDSRPRTTASTLLKAAFGDALPRAGEVAVDGARAAVHDGDRARRRPARRVRAGVAADRPRCERRAQDRARPRQFVERRRPHPQPAGRVGSGARADAADRRRPADAQPQRPARRSIPASMRATS